mmetsp:Transcript_24229/g.49029  ORF Transcript_24229/g.49029 Transcript_24229/m.49029 type:complete len:308 (-) Transcript_24229:364-1287(-)
MQHAPKRLRFRERARHPEASLVLGPQPPARQHLAQPVGTHTSVFAKLRHQLVQQLVRRLAVRRREHHLSKALLRQAVPLGGMVVVREQRVHLRQRRLVLVVELGDVAVLLGSEQPQGVGLRARRPLADHNHVLDPAQPAPRGVEVVSREHQPVGEAERLLVQQRKVLEGVERVRVCLVGVLAGGVQGEHRERPRRRALLVSAVLALDKLLHLDLLLPLDQHLLLLLLLLLALLLRVQPVRALVDHRELRNLLQHVVPVRVLLRRHNEPLVHLQHVAQLLGKRDRVGDCRFERKVDGLVKHFQRLPKR